VTTATALPGPAARESSTSHVPARTWPWLAVLLCVGAMALWLSHGWLKAPYITNDGYEYLDGAASLASGGCFCTGTAQDDTEVGHGRLPIELTHFPPGYPLLIAGISHLGVSRETAGYLISAAAYLVSIWLLWDIGILLGGPPVLTFILAALWITNYQSIVYASAILTESLFIAMWLAMTLLFVRDLKAEGRKPALLVLIGGLAGAAYWLRYAGLLLAPPALLYILWRCWRNRETMPWALSGVFAVFFLVVPVQIRNVIYSGYWRGWSPSHVPHAWGHSLVRLIAVSYQIALGDLAVIPLSIWVVLSALTIVIVLRWGFGAWQRGEWSTPGKFLPLALAWIGVFVLSYVAGIMGAPVSSLDMDMTRYNLPVYPVLLAALAGAASLFPFTALRLTLAITATAVLVLQGLTFTQRPPGPYQHSVIAEDLQQNVSVGQPLGSWLLDRVPPGAVIVSEQGQPLHYLLQRPVVSILEPPEVSELPSDGAAFFARMSRFKARYLLLFPAMQPPARSFPFLVDLVSGQVPGWLKLRIRTPHVAVFECDLCAR
jgi:hypothetical protein